MNTPGAVLLGTGLMAGITIAVAFGLRWWLKKGDYTSMPVTALERQREKL